MNRGIIGTIIGVLVIIISGDRDFSAHLSAEPGAGKARKWLPALARLPNARSHPECRPN